MNGGRGGVRRIVAIVLLAGNAVAIAANAALLFGGGIGDVMDWAVALLTAPIVAGLVGFARRRRWGRLLSSLALAAQIVLFAVHLGRTWGHLHGGEWLLVAWVALAAVALLAVLVTPAEA
jgi:hypothetical protein